MCLNFVEDCGFCPGLHVAGVPAGGSCVAQFPLSGVSMCSLERRGSVWILTLLGDGEHRLNPDFIRCILDALETVRSCGEHKAAALVTVNEGNYYSNGLDLDWAKVDFEVRAPVQSRALKQLLAAFMRMPMPTVAAICGHACAGGALLAMAHDYRYMRKDRGYFYMSEVDIHVRIPGGPMRLIRGKLTPNVLRDSILRGVKYTGEAALEAGIVDAVCTNSKETADLAMKEAELLASRGWDAQVYVGLRMEIHKETVEALESLQDSHPLAKL